MPAYITIEDLSAVDIPAAFLTQALDDDNDGVADAGQFAAIAQASSDDVDAFLAGRFTVPFSPVPPLVKRAARIFTLERLYLKRGQTGANNPWTQQADALREQLTQIANGELPLALENQRGKPSGTIIGDRAKTHSAAGYLTI